MMWGLRSSRTVVVGIAMAAFVMASVLPLGYMLVQSASSGIWNAAVLLDARQRALLLDTALLGVGTALLATAIGAPLGLVLARVTVPLKSALRVALAAPLALPPYVVGLAWVYLAGPVGAVASLTGLDVLSAWTYTLPAAVLVLSLVLYPLSMLATEVALRRIEPRLEEAGLVFASPGRVLWRISAPLAAPAVAAAALVVFVLAVSEFGVPGLLRVRVFTTEVFTAFAAQYDSGRATLLALPLLALSTFAAVVATSLVGEQLVVTRRGLMGAEPRLLPGWVRQASAAAACVLVLALVTPLAVLIREALDVSPDVLRGSGSAIGRSLVLSVLGASLVTVIAIWLGYGRARALGRLGVVTDVLWVVLFAVPSTVVGVGLIGIWNRDAPFGRVYGTDGMLLLAYLARFLPVAALVLATAVRYVPVSHEEAAAVGGAGWWRVMIRIVLPQVGPGLVAAWTVVFVLAFGELGASILVAPPGETTLPIRIYTLVANAPAADLAALALLQSGVILLPLSLLALGLAARRTR